jgi:alpha-D-ribose 1-methylphosphonate 5-triphosphate diphosphatase PhnM
MTLINHPGHYQQMAMACLDAGIAADIVTMLDDLHAVLAGLHNGQVPAAAAQAEAILDDTGSDYNLAGLADAVFVTRLMLGHAVKDATAHIPDVPC